MPAACRMWPAAIAPAEFRPTIKPTARPRATALAASAPICVWRRIFCIAASFPDHPPEIVSPQGWTAGYGHGVPDAIFTHPRLAAIYDAFDGPRDDLAAYAGIAEELGAHRVLDVGCGTGCLALLLARSGYAVVAVDPATASLEVARSKGESAAVNWIQGDAAQLPAVGADLAVMTGNVAHVFLSDTDWAQAWRPSVARCARTAIWCSRPGGPAAARDRTGRLTPARSSSTSLAAVRLSSAVRSLP